MKRVASLFRFPACALLGLCSVLPVAAQSRDAADRARIDAIAREAAGKYAVAINQADQTRPPTAAPPAGTQINLTLDEATARALERNLTLSVQRLNPQTFDLQIARLRAAYQPTASSQINQQSRVTPPTSTLNGGSIVNLTTNTYN